MFNSNSTSHSQVEKLSNEERVFQLVQECISKGHHEEGISMLFILITKNPELEGFDGKFEEELDYFHYYIEEVGRSVEKLLTYVLKENKEAGKDSIKISYYIDIINITTELDETSEQLPDIDYFFNLRRLRKSLEKAGLETDSFDGYINQLMERLEEMKADCLYGAQLLLARPEDLTFLSRILSFTKLVDIVLEELECMKGNQEIQSIASWEKEEKTNFILSIDYSDIEIYGLAEMMTQMIREDYFDEDDCPF